MGSEMAYGNAYYRLLISGKCSFHSKSPSYTVQVLHGNHELELTAWLCTLVWYKRLWLMLVSLLCSVYLHGTDVGVSLERKLCGVVSCSIPISHHCLHRRQMMTYHPVFLLHCCLLISEENFISLPKAVIMLPNFFFLPLKLFIDNIFFTQRKNIIINCNPDHCLA